MSALPTVVSALLGLTFLRAGLPKILRTPHYRERVDHWRLPAGLLPLIGVVEVGGAVLLIVGAATQTTLPAAVGAVLLITTMAGAVVTHVRIADPLNRALPAVVLGAVAVLNVVLMAGRL